MVSKGAAMNLVPTCGWGPGPAAQTGISAERFAVRELDAGRLFGYKHMERTFSFCVGPEPQVGRRFSLAQRQEWRCHIDRRGPQPNSPSAGSKRRGFSSERKAGSERAAGQESKSDVFELKTIISRRA